MICSLDACSITSDHGLNLNKWYFLYISLVDERMKDTRINSCFMVMIMIEILVKRLIQQFSN